MKSASAAERVTTPRSSLAREVAHLEDILWRELDRYRCLCDLLLREKEILTKNRPEELPELLEQQKDILLEARALEPQRIGALRRVAEQLGVPGPITLQTIAENLSGDARARVEKLRAALVHVVPRVDQINRINVLLIRNSMTFISTTVRAILEEGPARAGTYLSSGETATTGTPTSWTDRRA